MTQRVSVLAAEASASDIKNVATATNEQFFKSISYSSVDSVVKQCDGKRHDEGNLLRGNIGSATSGRFNGYYKHRNKYKMTKELYEKKTMKSPCEIFEKYRHWKNEYLPYGSLPPGVTSVDKLLSDTRQYDCRHSINHNNDNKQTVAFSNSKLLSSQHKTANPDEHIECTCNRGCGHECIFWDDWSLPDSKDTFHKLVRDYHILNNETN